MNPSPPAMGVRVRVYSKPMCQQCRMTKMWLDRRGVAYEEIDISQDVDAFQAVQELGYTAAPIVVVRPLDSDEDVHWSGFNDHRLEQYVLPMVLQAASAS